ncbi:MAG: hypothetical protein CM15mV51_0800 [uncultured marine virus]|nr:MAG: hypothetical protein CM15mV51_0800 [uncultured marine virus]
MISGGKAAATPQPAGTFELFDSDKILANKGMMRTGKPKMGIKRMFPELANNDELFNSPQAELLRMYNVNASFDPRVAVAIAQGLIPSDDEVSIGTVMVVKLPLN